MKKINISILFANILTGLAFLAHTIGGDIEINSIQPAININNWAEKQQIWTMARCGWHWISFDLLFASIALALVNFTNFFDNKKTILQLLSCYFFGYAIVWLLLILISNSFPDNFLKLGQWMLLLTISGLIYYGTKKQNA
ncbi:hypothetical protein [Flavobacterium sp. GT3P67]|uniref:hypothetical protein n=1 Tax=Flavobacterium sp. GT3P67 TaxID=2541722 RepID=UPI00197AC8FB|nr:hypothetical protein [Flavobacterium sp. GT3P67]